MEAAPVAVPEVTPVAPEVTPVAPEVTPVAPEVTPVAVEDVAIEAPIAAVPVEETSAHFDAPTDAAPATGDAPTGERKKYDDINKIYVENIPNESTDEEVKEYFSRSGEVVDFALRRGKTFKFAFIGFSNEADFKDALELNGKEFNGAALTVEVRKPRGERAPRERNANNNNNNNNNNSRFNRDRAPMAGQRRGRDDSRDRYPRRDDDRRDLRRRDDDRRPPMGGADERKCFRCGQLGHIAMKCPTGTVCFTCNGVGHRSTECPTRLNGGGRGRSPPRRRSPPRDYRRDRSPPRDYYRRDRSPPRDYRRRSYTPPRDYRRRSYSPVRDNRDTRDTRDNNYSPRRSPSQ